LGDRRSREVKQVFDLGLFKNNSQEEEFLCFFEKSEIEKLMKNCFDDPWLTKGYEPDSNQFPIC
jgi:hypothetical protein